MIFSCLFSCILWVSWASEIRQKTFQVLFPEDYLRFSKNFRQQSCLKEILHRLELNSIMKLNQLDGNELIMGLFLVDKFLSNNYTNLKYEEELEKIGDLSKAPDLTKESLGTVRTFLYSHVVLLGENLPKNVQNIISTTLEAFDRALQERHSPNISIETDFEVKSLSDWITLASSKIEIDPKRLTPIYNSSTRSNSSAHEPYFFQPLREFAKKIYQNKSITNEIPYKGWEDILNKLKVQCEIIREKAAGDFAYFLASWDLTKKFEMVGEGQSYIFKDLFSLILRISSFGKFPEVPTSSSGQGELIQRCYLQHLLMFLKHLKCIERVFREKRMADWIAQMLLRLINYSYKFLDEIRVSLGETKYYERKDGIVVFMKEFQRIIKLLEQNHKLAKTLPVRNAILKLPTYSRFDFSESHILNMKLSFKQSCIISQATFSLVYRFFSLSSSSL